MRQKQQQDEREQLQTLQQKQQHKTTYPKKKQEKGYDANTNCTIVSHILYIVNNMVIIDI